MHNRAHKHKSKNVHNTHVHSQLTPFHCQMILVPRALFVRQLMRSYWTFAPLAVAYLGLVAFSYTPDMLSLLLPGSLEAGMSGQPCTQAHTKKHTHHKQTHTYAHACTAVLCLFCMHFAPTWSFCVWMQQTHLFGECNSQLWSRLHREMAVDYLKGRVTTAKEIVPHSCPE